MEGHLTSRVIIAEAPGEDPVLWVEVEIDCPLCGRQAIQIAGHHLRTIRDVLVDTVDLYPELTKASYRKIESTQITARGNDPSTS